MRDLDEQIDTMFEKCRTIYGDYTLLGDINAKAVEWGD